MSEVVVRARVVVFGTAERREAKLRDRQIGRFCGEQNIRYLLLGCLGAA